jgi:hypothetical protein
MSVAEAVAFEQRGQANYALVTVRGRLVDPGLGQCRDRKTGRSCLAIADSSAGALTARSLCLTTAEHECVPLEVGGIRSGVLRMQVCANGDSCCSTRAGQEVIVSALFFDAATYEFRGPICTVASDAR